MEEESAASSAYEPGIFFNDGLRRRRDLAYIAYLDRCSGWGRGRASDWQTDDKTYIIAEKVGFRSRTISVTYLRKNSVVSPTRSLRYRTSHRERGGHNG